MTAATGDLADLVISVTPRNRANFRRLKTNSIQSVKRWEKENELLYAMMEDESEWLAKLFPDVVISPEFFFYSLEDGSLLCRLANYIQEKADLYSQKYRVVVPGKKFRYHTMGKSTSKEIKLFRSRENVQQFLVWCRSHGLPEAILFESNDVVQVDDYREGCRGVIICLMEIVRRTARFDLDELPQLIQLEKEIEEDEANDDSELSNAQGEVLDVEEISTTEMDNLEVHVLDQADVQSPSSLDSDSGVDSVFDQDEGENTASRLTEFSQDEKTITSTVTSRKQVPAKPKDQRSSRKKDKEPCSLLESKGPKSELDKQVCKIAQDYNIKIVHRLKEGKYIILGRTMFVRMLNDHMLVRIGGGWDTLEHYLMTHAPSKEALEAASTPSCQAATSPRNSISTGSGVRSSLIERTKKKEQLGVTTRDSVVYSSQGNLNQQLGVQCTPKIREKGKRSSLIHNDEKDITDAIRKISSSVSQNLLDRPASFTSKTFHQLRSRFDKGIFGSERRTSSPDLTFKGKKLPRRLSDTPRMADVAATFAFDGDRTSPFNDNDASAKQSESMEESSEGRVSQPSEDSLGVQKVQRDISPPEHIDNTGTSLPAVDLLSLESCSRFNVNGGASDDHVDGCGQTHEKLSFRPLAAAHQQDKQILIGISSLDKPQEQPKTMDGANDGVLSYEEEPEQAILEAMVESSLPVDVEDMEPGSTFQASPRPIDLGDLLLDSETKAEEGTTKMQTETAQVEEGTRDEHIAAEDLVSSTPGIHPFENPPPQSVVEIESELAPCKDESTGGGLYEPTAKDDVPPVDLDVRSETEVKFESASQEVQDELIEMEQLHCEERAVNEDVPREVQNVPPVETYPMEETALGTGTEPLKQEGKPGENDQANKEAPADVQDVIVNATEETVFETESEFPKQAEEPGEAKETTEIENVSSFLVETHSTSDTELQTESDTLGQERELDYSEQVNENASTNAPSVVVNPTGEAYFETKSESLNGIEESSQGKQITDVENPIPVETDFTAETETEHLKHEQDSDDKEVVDEEPTTDVQDFPMLSVNPTQGPVVATEPEKLYKEPSGAELAEDAENVPPVKELPIPDTVVSGSLEPLKLEEESSEAKGDKLDDPAMNKDEVASFQDVPPVAVESKPTGAEQETVIGEELVSSEESARESLKIEGEERTCKEPGTEMATKSSRLEREYVNRREETVNEESELPEIEGNLVAAEHHDPQKEIEETVKPETKAHEVEGILVAPEQLDPQKKIEETVKPETKAHEVEGILVAPELLDPQKKIEETIKPETKAHEVEGILVASEQLDPQNKTEVNGIEDTVKHKTEWLEFDGNLAGVEGPCANEELVVEEPESAKAAEPSSSVESNLTSRDSHPKVGKSSMLEDGAEQGSGEEVTEKVQAKVDEPVDIQKTEKPTGRATKSKTATANTRPKSPPKLASGTKQTSPKKGIDATKPTPKLPSTKNNAKGAAPKPATSKAPASKAPVNAAVANKKPAVKPTATKTNEIKKAEKPKAAEPTRSSLKISETKPIGAIRVASSTAKKTSPPTTQPTAGKAPGKDVRDAGPAKTAPKTTTRPPSAKSAPPKPTLSTAKSIPAKATRSQSANAVDIKENFATEKKRNVRPQSTKPKPPVTTTNFKKTTTTTTSTTKGGAGALKSQTSTTKKLMQEKSGQTKVTTTTTTATKTAVKTSAPKPTSASAKTSSTAGGAKSKINSQPRAGTTGSKPAAKSAAKTTAQKHPEEKTAKSTTDEATTGDVKTTTEVVEKDVEQPVEVKSTENTSDQFSPTFSITKQTFETPNVFSEKVVEQSNLFPHVVTCETTTVIKDGEEESTTTTEKTTFEESLE
ncbi:microtubule-associated protein futsch-like [Montipora capricornis]|uniref:microtubule-associated protein futsch-like n=1 Tax=Montipora capricornis TaxID=246305 RepID=UPI0035F16673